MSPIATADIVTTPDISSINSNSSNNNNNNTSLLSPKMHTLGSSTMSANLPAGQLSEPETTYISTEPSQDHHWRITLEDKVIAITGANRGIGLGIAEVCLANSAAHIYSLDLFEPDSDSDSEPTPTSPPSKSATTTTYRSLSERYPNRVHYLHCDVTSPPSIESAIDTVISTHGRLDGMIANAGATKHKPALTFSPDDLSSLFNLNVFGAYHCATIAARTMIRLGRPGSIIFTSSMTSYRPNRAAPSAPYGATKAAIRNLTNTLAMEWAKHGIRVNCVSPGFVRTQMTTYYVEKDKEEWDRKMRYYGGMPRLAEPRELGGAYVYLLSEGASYTTGIDIPIAGIVGAW